MAALGSPRSVDPHSPRSVGPDSPRQGPGSLEGRTRDLFHEFVTTTTGCQKKQPPGCVDRNDPARVILCEEQLRGCMQRMDSARRSAGIGG